MKCKIYAKAFCILIIFALTGCQLAKEDMVTDTGEDRLVGAFITTEHLDLFDLAGYLNDNLKGFQGGNINVDGNTEKFKGRLYATQSTKIRDSEETGDTPEIDYVFPVEGIPYFSVNVLGKGDNDSYFASVSDPAISDGHIDYKVGDDVNSIELKGTIYVAATGAEYSFILNPVYQSPDGSVYLMEGSSVTGKMDREGTTMSQNMEATTTITENGKTKSDNISITISVAATFPPAKIAVLQMDEESDVLSRMEFEPDAMPESISTEQKTDYVIVETSNRDDTAQTKISRAIYGRDAENIETFIERKDGICLKQLTQLKWAR